MSWIYNFIFFIFAIASIPKFLIRLNQADDARALLRERFGIFPETFRRFFADEKTVWLHAVSVGEVMTARVWLEHFLARHKDWKVAFSTTTPTGYAVARKFGLDRVLPFYAPFDLSFSVRRVLRALSPRLILLMETEIWPNFISEASRARIPIGIVNGRISPRAFGRYRLVRFWTSAMLRKLSFCLVQSERDWGFFLKLGMYPEKLFCTGNMKFDSTSAARKAHADYSRTELYLPPEALVLIGGSTHKGEEVVLLNLFRRLKLILPDLRLI